MNHLFIVAKYQLWDFRKSVTIFYGVITVLIAALLVGTYVFQIDGESNFAGTALVFLFIWGLNCFKTNYKFLQANNVTRKIFYLGNILAITTMSIFMGAIEAILSKGLSLVVTYNGIFEQLYNNQSVFADLLWSSSTLLFAVSLGWLITLIYYRCTVVMKVLVSISPVIFIALFIYINSITNGKLGAALAAFMIKAMGLNNGNYQMGVLSFIIATIITYLPIYLLMRNVPIKD